MKIESISILVTTAVCFLSISLAATSHACGYKFFYDCDSQCYRDEDCPNYEMCHENKCVNACDHSPPCGTNANCFTDKHKRVCECLPDMIGDPYNQDCRRGHHDSSCDNDDKKCADNQVCSGNKCVNPCESNSPCGPNATCTAKNHFRICECPHGLTGRPYDSRGCSKPVKGCWNNQDCKEDQVCYGGKCIYGCDEQPSCGYNTQCTVSDHIRECKCSPGYEGEPYGLGCNKHVTDPCCNNDVDCSDDEICIEAKCIKACDHSSWCGANAYCITTNHKSTCECSPGFTKSPHVNGCVKPTYDPCCYNSVDCADYETCVENKCVNTCDHESSCGYNATCSAINHIRICQCLPGQTGDPYGDGCKSLNTYPCCHSDTECANDEICVHEKCVNACDDYHKSLCGPNSICTTNNHISRCKCLHGFSGNPYGYGCAIQTPVPDCCDDIGCRHNEVCIAGKCVTVCRKPFCI